MSDHVLIMTGIIHEQILDMLPFFPRHLLDSVPNPLRGNTHLVVSTRIPPARIQYEPGLIGAFKSQRVTTASVPRAHDAGRDGLKTERHTSTGHGFDDVELGGRGDNRSDLLVERDAGLEAGGKPVPAACREEQKSVCCPSL